MTTKYFTMRSSGLPPVEPASICDACGAMGTVGRVFRSNANDEMLDLHRFCLTCWSSESERVLVRLEEQQAARSRAADLHETSNDCIQAESATWDTAVFLVTGIEAALQNEDPHQAPISLDDLARLAEQMATRAAGLVGPMPDVVARFIRQYRANGV